MTGVDQLTGRRPETLPEASAEDESAGTRYCIMSHNRSLPENLGRFGRMIRKNRALSAGSRHATDVDWLLALSEGRYDTIWWTAPEDLEPGGILLIHLRGLPGRTVDPDLLAEARKREGHGGEPLAANLLHAEKLAGVYGETIFVAARVGGIAEEFVGNRGETTHSVLLNRAHVFGNPLPVGRISDVVRIGEGLFTRLGRDQFVRVRERLSEGNALPDFLAEA